MQSRFGGTQHGALGKTRHIEVQYFWVQKDVLEGELKVVKVGTDDNLAVLMTKHLKAETSKFHLEGLAYRTALGRAKSALGIGQCAVGDYWESQRRIENWIRRHQKQMMCLFTKIKVAGGPINAAAVGNTRVTVGQFHDGKQFC